MNPETINALAQFAEEVSHAVNQLNGGFNLDTDPLADANRRLCEALAAELEPPRLQCVQCGALFTTLCPACEHPLTQLPPNS